MDWVAKGMAGLLSSVSAAVGGALGGGSGSGLMDASYPDPLASSDPKKQVWLSVYDMTAVGDQLGEHTGTVQSGIMGLNKVTNAIGAGGVFHGGVAFAGKEWSFGYTPNGTGVFHVRPMENTMYTPKGRVYLGDTALSESEVLAIAAAMQKEADWMGTCYDLTAKNCCHFCHEFAKRLGVRDPPGWLNRMARTANATKEAAGMVVGAASGLLNAGKNLLSKPAAP